MSIDSNWKQKLNNRYSANRKMFQANDFHRSVGARARG